MNVDIRLQVYECPQSRQATAVQAGGLDEQVHRHPYYGWTTSETCPLRIGLDDLAAK